MNKVQRWEIIGVFFIVGLGATLHYWFEWTDYWRPIALIAPVNESLWEHLKMAFWPGFFYALIEYPFLKQETNNFLVAKSAGLFTMPVMITILFYGYTSMTGIHLLWADVIIFILSIISGQWISLRILTKTEKMKPITKNFAIAGLVIMVLAFSLLSYFPPKNFLFADTETGEYGILSDYDHDHHP